MGMSWQLEEKKLYYLLLIQHSLKRDDLYIQYMIYANVSTKERKQKCNLVCVIEGNMGILLLGNPVLL